MAAPVQRSSSMLDGKAHEPQLAHRKKRNSRRRQGAAPQRMQTLTQPASKQQALEQILRPLQLAAAKVSCSLLTQAVINL